jgi:hypothetical protein
MIARSQPVAIRTKPDPPEDDDARLRKLREALQRHLVGASRVNTKILKLEERIGKEDRL